MRIGDIVKNNKDNKDYQLISSSKKESGESMAKLYIFRPLADIEKEEKEEKEAKEEKINKEKENEKLPNLIKRNDLKIKFKKEDK